MKKYLLLVIAIFTVSVYSNAQRTYTYRMLGVNKQVQIDNFGISLNIHVGGNRMTDDVVLCLSGNDDVSAFAYMLKGMRTKFAEWSKVAKENHVTDFSKMIGLYDVNAKVEWTDGRGRHSRYISSGSLLDREKFGATLMPMFHVSQNGCKVYVSGSVWDGYGAYRSQTNFKLEFNNIADLDKLIKIVDSYSSVSEEHKNWDSLFK